MFIALLALALVCALGSTAADAKKPAKVKAPKPPKERKIDAAVTKRPTQLRTESGLVVMNLPEGLHSSPRSTGVRLCGCTPPAVSDTGCLLKTSR